MVIHRRPCWRANSSSCGVLAICPVRLSTTSDSTPAAETTVSAIWRLSGTRCSRDHWTRASVSYRLISVS